MPWPGLGLALAPPWPRLGPALAPPCPRPGPGPGSGHEEKFRLRMNVSLGNLENGFSQHCQVVAGGGKVFQGRACQLCLEPMGPEKTLNARYCSTRCKALANANRKRLARFESRRERSAALASHKVWLFSFQKLVIGSAPAEAVGFQLGAALGDTVLWLPCQSGRKKSRRTCPAFFSPRREAVNSLAGVGRC